MRKFDLVVLGGGPGGYVAAIKAAQSGKSIALVESGELGGTCLNRGCIPTKTLLANAEALVRVREAEKFGISTGKVNFDFSKMAKRKDKVVSTMLKGLSGLVSAHKVTIIPGHGKFLSPYELKISGETNETIQGNKFIIATGSEPRDLKPFPIDGKKIHNSTTFLKLTKLPKSLIVLGGGVVGSEFASMYADMDVSVTILEMLPEIIVTEGKSCSAALASAFKDKGIDIQCNVSAEKAEATSKGVKVTLAGGKTVEAEMMLVSVGRKLNTNDIGLEKAGVRTLDNGVIEVNSKMETGVPGIYAIGDITWKMQLAHVASHQGIVAASNAMNMEEMHMEYNAIPSVVYTSPEVATVGMTYEAAVESGYNASLGTFPFQALGKAQAIQEPHGFAQIVADKDTGAILGAQVVGHEAANLIAEMGVAITNELTVESIFESVHAHPTISEAWPEAALLTHGTPIHLPPSPKSKAKKEMASAR